jgi:hypothetical protein
MNLGLLGKNSTQVGVGLSDEPATLFLIAPNEYHGWRNYEGDCRMKRWCIGWYISSSINFQRQDKEVLGIHPSTPDEPTQSVEESYEWRQQICNDYVTWKGTGWTDADKKGASVHPMVCFSATFSQWIVLCCRCLEPATYQADYLR